MLPIIAVLLVVAQSAIAAPSVAVSAYPVNQYPVIPDSGRFVNSFIIDGAAAYLDAAELPLYIQMLLASVQDMANSADIATQAGAVLNGLVTIGELVSGIPGDACDTAALINAYAYSVNSGNNAGLQQALGTYVGRLSVYIDLITQLIVNPSSVKYTVGPRGSCLGGGRTYQFEEAWDGILNNANPFQIGLLNEVYCASRRMYNAFTVRNNNVAAAITAASIPPVNQLAQGSLNSLVPFLRAVANGANPTQAGATAKAGLVQAVSTITY